MQKMNEKKSKKQYFLFISKYFLKNEISLKHGVFKRFTKITCGNRLYYAEFGLSCLQKRLKYGGNVKNKLFLVIF